ncbi:energy transducer TonB [Hymenobacter guriensis]|uniref:TonB family protein n=1 Tax=Hymenobacter guriensis TaxID=2793065 RepID=A0ABS0L4F9_9BACT|nr:TonB family protein [Hymenobacter guriensis]MBG8555038.1 TonB family protein [Hymenobacter guriensis]
MRLSFFILSICLFSTKSGPSWAQAGRTAVLPLRHLQRENNPQFPGGPQALQAYFVKSIKQPAEVTSGAIQGEVLVRCILRPDGRVDSARVTRSLSPATDQEALRVVRGMPAWKPGVSGNQPVGVYYYLHVPFPLPANAELWPAQGEDALFTYTGMPPYFPGGNKAFAAALQQHLVLPAGAPTGQILAAFVVDPAGRVRDAKIERGMGPPYDEAVLLALRKIPRFVPGQASNAGTVAMEHKAMIPIGGTTTALPRQVFPFGHQTYPFYGGSRHAQEQAIRSRVRYPALARRRELEGIVIVRLPIAADGTPDLAAAHVVKGLGDGCDEEALRVVRTLERFTPAQQNGEPVAQETTITVPFALEELTAPPAPRPPARRSPK